MNITVRTVRGKLITITVVLEGKLGEDREAKNRPIGLIGAVISDAREAYARHSPHSSYSTAVSKLGAGLRPVWFQCRGHIDEGFLSLVERCGGCRRC